MASPAPTAAAPPPTADDQYYQQQQQYAPAYAGWDAAQQDPYYYYHEGHSGYPDYPGYADQGYAGHPGYTGDQQYYGYSGYYGDYAVPEAPPVTPDVTKSSTILLRPERPRAPSIEWTSICLMFFLTTICTAAAVLLILSMDWINASTATTGANETTTDEIFVPTIDWDASTTSQT